MNDMTDTEPYHPIDPAHQLTRDTYLQMVDTLRWSLPPPLVDTPEAWALHVRTAVDRVAALLPASSVEAEQASLQVATLAYSKDCLRLAGLHAATDAKRADQCLAQSVRMGRAAAAYEVSLLRMQKERRRREGTEEGAVGADRLQHSVLGLMLDALESLPAVPANAAVPVLAARAAAPVQAAAPVAEAVPAPAKRVFIDYDDLPEEVKAKDRRAAKASRYAVVNTMRVQEIRKCGGLPPGADYEIEPELLHDILNGVGGNFAWADTYVPWVAPEGYVPPKD